MERKGVEPSTSALLTQTDAVVSDDSHEFPQTPKLGCTTGCTSEPETLNEPPPLSLDVLAAALAKLSPADRAKLAAMLTTDAKTD